MKLFFSLFWILLSAFCSVAQTKLFTKTGTISFHSKTSMENIDAVNNKVLSVWNVEDGRLEFSVLMKGFLFKKALMQEHFNESYVESDKYPKATFKGVIENSETIAVTGTNTYNVKVAGSLTIHGVTRPLVVPAVIKVVNGEVSATASFIILLSHFNIKIPAVVSENISKNITVNIIIHSYKPA